MKYLLKFFFILFFFFVACSVTHAQSKMTAAQNESEHVRIVHLLKHHIGQLKGLASDPKNIVAQNELKKEQNLLDQENARYAAVKAQLAKEKKK